MSLSKYLLILQRLDGLIRTRATGSPSALAKRFNVSTRMIHYYINDLKELGADVEYDYTKRSYYYQTEFHILGKPKRMEA